MVPWQIRCSYKVYRAQLPGDGAKGCHIVTGMAYLPGTYCRPIYASDASTGHWFPSDGRRIFHRCQISVCQTAEGLWKRFWPAAEGAAASGREICPKQRGCWYEANERSINRVKQLDWKAFTRWRPLNRLGALIMFPPRWFGGLRLRPAAGHAGIVAGPGCPAAARTAISDPQSSHLYRSLKAATFTSAANSGWARRGQGPPLSLRLRAVGRQSAPGRSEAVGLGGCR